MEIPIKKIVIIGPESTGKSILCNQLARHYQTNYCPEYAREYLLENGTAYTFETLLEIAKGQISLEEKLTAASIEKQLSKIFIDTDMYVMKVWCEFVFGKCHPWILEQIALRHYDLYLLCNTDLPWVKDELREYPDLENRKKLFLFYKDLLINQSTPWAEISGGADERLSKAIKVVDNMLAG